MSHPLDVDSQALVEEQRRSPLRVLLIEDSEDDALLIADVLRSGGYEPFYRRVERPSEMRLALSDAAWDLILADHRLPGFSALEAFGIYRELQLDIPFLIVSGAISEETAVSAMKAGVHDYLSKGNLARLAPAVKRELREAEMRRERKVSEEALRAAHEELAAVYANAPVVLLVVDDELRVQKANDMALQFTGRGRPEIVGLRVGEAIGCSNALASFGGCGHGPSCAQCSLRLAAVDSAHQGTRHSNIERWIPVSSGGQAQQRCLLISTAPLQIEKSRRALICAQDITELKRSAEELERQRNQLASQAESINLCHDAIITADPSGVITGWNTGATELYGWTAEEAEGRVIHDLLRTKGDLSMHELDTVLAQKGRWDGEVTHQMKDGRTRIVESRQILVRDATGSAAGILEVDRDITERKRAEQSLREASELRRLALEAAELGAWEYRPHSGEVIWDARCCKIFAIASDAPMNYEQSLLRIHPEDRGATDEAIKQAIAGRNGGTYHHEFRVLWPDGSIHWIASHGRVYFEAVNGQDRAARFIGVGADISEQKRAEQELESQRERLALANRDLDRRLEELHSALEQQNVLLREVQHRVKNNLQVISSMLALEAERFEDGNVLKAFQESRDRVRSMALIHDKFCHSDDLAQIDFGEYVESLATYFFSSYGSDRNAIKLSTNVNVKLGMDEAIPCGLIIQELLSNSMKHAFPNGEGEIRIEFYRSSQELKLCYRDSGVGLRAGVDLENPESLGLQLVTDLAGQLKGRLEYRYAGGAMFLLSFPSRCSRMKQRLEVADSDSVRFLTF